MLSIKKKNKEKQSHCNGSVCTERRTIYSISLESQRSCVFFVLFFLCVTELVKNKSQTLTVPISSSCRWRVGVVQGGKTLVWLTGTQSSRSHVLAFKKCKKKLILLPSEGGGTHLSLSFSMFQLLMWFSWLCLKGLRILVVTMVQRFGSHLTRTVLIDVSFLCSPVFASYWLRGSSQHCALWGNTTWC